MPVDQKQPRQRNTGAQQGATGSDLTDVINQAGALSNNFTYSPVSFNTGMGGGAFKGSGGGEGGSPYYSPQPEGRQPAEGGEITPYRLESAPVDRGMIQELPSAEENPYALGGKEYKANLTGAELEAQNKKAQEWEAKYQYDKKYTLSNRRASALAGMGRGARLSRGSTEYRLGATLGGLLRGLFNPKLAAQYQLEEDTARINAENALYTQNSEARTRAKIAEAQLKGIEEANRKAELENRAVQAAAEYFNPPTPQPSTPGGPTTPSTPPNHQNAYTGFIASQRNTSLSGQVRSNSGIAAAIANAAVLFPDSGNVRARFRPTKATLDGLNSNLEFGIAFDRFEKIGSSGYVRAVTTNGTVLAVFNPDGTVASQADSIFTNSNEYAKTAFDPLPADADRVKTENRNIEITRMEQANKKAQETLATQKFGSISEQANAVATLTSYYYQYPNLTSGSEDLKKVNSIMIGGQLVPVSDIIGAQQTTEGKTQEVEFATYQIKKGKEIKIGNQLLGNPVNPAKDSPAVANAKPPDRALQWNMQSVPVFATVNNSIVDTLGRDGRKLFDANGSFKKGAKQPDYIIAVSATQKSGGRPRPGSIEPSTGEFVVDAEKYFLANPKQLDAIPGATAAQFKGYRMYIILSPQGGSALKMTLAEAEPSFKPGPVANEPKPVGQ